MPGTGNFLPTMASPSAAGRTTTTATTINNNSINNNNHDDHLAQSFVNTDSKRKRRPAGTPDPDAEVVSLSAETLLESERYVCEICNQGFQRDQNLQMHRRRHKVPWKLVKREIAAEVRKRVFVCPEPSCLHHDPCHALGDLVGIKKHFRRKHSNHKQWACGRCSKAYAVQSDYKAHLKTCGTRGHSCDCGRVFSRVESFIEHQDACNGGRAMTEPQTPGAPCLSRTTSSSCPSGDTNLSSAAAMWPMLKLPPPPLSYLRRYQQLPSHNLELQLLPTSNPLKISSTPPKSIGKHCENHHNINYMRTLSGRAEDYNNSTTQLHLSVGLSNQVDEKPTQPEERNHQVEEAEKQLRLAMEEKVAAVEARRKAKRQIEIAEEEFSNAKRIRQQAQTELSRAMVERDQAVKQINAMMLQVTCNACKQQLGAKGLMALDENLLSVFDSNGRRE